jgi:hypothetical protein
MLRDFDRRLRSAATLEEASREVHSQHGAAFRNDKHRAQCLVSLEADVFPVFGARRVDQVDTADMLKALTPVWTVKPETARRLKQRIKVVLAWAKASGSAAVTIRWTAWGRCCPSRILRRSTTRRTDTERNASSPSLDRRSPDTPVFRPRGSESECNGHCDPQPARHAREARDVSAIDVDCVPLLAYR